MINNSQRGQSSIYIVIVVMIVIFAVMFSGGGSSLFTGNVATSVTDTPEPTGDSTNSLTSTPSVSTTITSLPSSANAAWSITSAFLGCSVNGFPRANIVSEGPQNGYIQLEVSNGAGGYDQVATARFIAPKSINTATLLSSIGFGTNAWRATLFSQGFELNGNWSGGTIQKVYNGNPTGC